MEQSSATARHEYAWPRPSTSCASAGLHCSRRAVRVSIPSRLGPLKEKGYYSAPAGIEGSGRNEHC